MRKLILDLDSTVPIHHQLAETIRESVRLGELRPGDRVPSERELCAELGLSRGTVRQSLSTLINEGLILTLRGKGNFVSTRKIEQTLLYFPSMVLGFRQGGRQLATRHLGATTLPATLTVARNLALTEGEPVIRIRRLRLLEGEPFLLTTSVVPASICPQLVGDNHEALTVFELLESRYGIRVARVKSNLETMALDEFQADLLGSHVSLPAFRLERVAYSSNDLPVVFTVHIVRGDRCRFTFESTEQIFAREAALVG